jgi:hypothetical protein
MRLPIVELLEDTVRVTVRGLARGEREETE